MSALARPRRCTATDCRRTAALARAAVHAHRHTRTKARSRPLPATDSLRRRRRKKLAGREPRAVSNRTRRARDADGRAGNGIDVGADLEGVADALATDFLC